MSFILDALKKSEKERQREAVPGIGDLPVVVHQTHASAWTVSLIAGLGLAVVALAFAWWRTSAPEAVAARLPMPVSPIAEPAPTAQPQPAATIETRDLASEATRVADTGIQPAAIAAPNTGRSATRTTGVITAGPPSITDARSAGLPVPELTLELLVYSNDPAKRFVYINSGKYAEGDSLPEGPKLMEITTEGAILSYRGQNYLLPQN